MASWGVGAESWPTTGEGLAHHPYVDGGKRRVSHSDGSDCLEQEELRSRKRFRATIGLDAEAHHPGFSEAPTAPTVPFLVLRESASPLPEPAVPRGASEPSSCSMERTESGLSISSDSSIYTTFTYEDSELLEDDKAAWLVEKHLLNYRRKAHRSRHERILRSLIQPRTREAEFSIDNAALESIFSAANEIFFYGRLSRRVTWDWSHSSSAQYQNQIIGTTALRRSRLQKGFETLIVLSHPILNDKKYNRRLLISTFLHELIHSYLFICCGFKARHCGGHTAGFRRIAELIDQWAGADTLHLQNMEADLDDFKQHEEEEDPINSAYRSPPGSQAAHLPEDYDYVSPYHPHYHERHHHHHYHHHHHQQERYPTPLEYPGRLPQDGWNFYVADRRENIASVQYDASSTPPPFHQHDAHQDAPEIVSRPVRWATPPDLSPTTSGITSSTHHYHHFNPHLHHLAPGSPALWPHLERRKLSQSPTYYPTGSPYVD